MSFPCVRGKPECDGCMLYRKESRVIGYCEACREAICEGDNHYSIEGDLVHDDCLQDWAAKYFVRG